MEKIDAEKLFKNPAAIVMLALLTCALWGSAFPAIKTGFAMLHIESAGSKILFAGYRFFLAGLITLGFISFSERRFVTIKKSSIPYIMVQGVLQTTIQYICFYIGLSNTTGAKGSIINGTNGLFAIIAAHFMTRSEKLSVKKLVGCALGFFGVVIVNIDGGSLGGFTFMGEGMVLLCSISYGISSVTLKMISGREKPNVITAYQLMFGGGILIVLGLITGGEVVGFTFLSVALLLYLALTSTISFCLWANLLKYNAVGKITIFGFSIPIFGVLLSAMFLGESVLNFNLILALFFVCFGIVMVNRE